MPAWLIAILIVLLAASATCLVYWLAVTREMIVGILQLPTARDGLSLEEGRLTPGKPWPTMCLVIPAHNEQDCIGLLVRSLLQQDYPALSVILALDRCTDNTESIARELIGSDPRFTIFNISSCPTDWAGKVNAVWTAVKGSPQAMQAEYLVFADADTEFDPACLRACYALLVNRQLGLLSLMSTVTTDTWFEKIAQPAAGFALLNQYPMLRANRDERRRPLANGQFMMFSRQAYFTINGHACSKAHLLEDLHMARSVQWAGFSSGLLLADGMLHCRMYRDWPEFVRGWKRIFTELGSRHADRIRKFATRMATFSVWLPLLSTLAAALGAVLWRQNGHYLALATLVIGLAAPAVMFASLMIGHSWSRVPLISSLTHPFGMWLIARIMRQAAADLDEKRGIAWGGKTYLRQAGARLVEAGSIEEPTSKSAS